MIQAGAIDGLRIDHEDVSVHHHETARWLVLERGPVRIVCNLAAQPQTVPVYPCAHLQVLLASEPVARLTSTGLDLPAHSVAILSG